MWTVTAIGATVRLVDDAGHTELVLLAALLAAPDLELIDSAPARGTRLTAVGLLEQLSTGVLERAREWERHVIEAETGFAPDATTARPGFEPSRTTVAERDTAKAGELTAAGVPTTARTIKRMRLRYRAQGLLGLVDHRSLRVSNPVGRVDPRVVAAARAAIGRETRRSTGTKSRLWRVVQADLAAEHGSDVVPLPSQRTFERLLDVLSAGQHTFGSATTRRTQANRPVGPFTPTAASRPGEVVQIDTTPLDVMAVLDDGVVGRVELTIALDVATRTIAAAVLRPYGTKAVDASLLLARTLVPEPMRPGWSDALAMAHSQIPYERLLPLDTRLQPPRPNR
ncbi:hypothetical protein AB0J55_00400 [Amycolatopsis sp. NPDC049688]|uniref:hypothetical protein n=1 Tax=Amycolatopsis sp. NPDC049688 TaxID=3154733 RepID=UPI00343A10B3